MAHWVLVLAVLVACKKKEEEPAPEPAPKSPSVGHSVTKVPDEPTAQAPAGSGSGSAPAHHEAAPADAAVTIDAPVYGGDGSPASRDSRGHIVPPGGPVFTGRGPECTDKIDHCLREGVYFSVGALVAGKLYRATPVFEFEGKWYNWFGRSESVDTAYKTKVAKAGELRAGDPVIWFIEDTKQWVSSEYDALTSSRWEAGIIESVSGATFRVKGWDRPVAIESARKLTERRKGS